MAEHIRFRTKSNGVTELTGQIKEIVENSGVRDGICAVSYTHLDVYKRQAFLQHLLITIETAPGPVF